VRQWDAGQRRVAGADSAGGVGGTRLGQGLLPVLRNEGVEAGIEAVDAVEEQGRQFDGGDLPGRQRGGQFAQATN
jgi:hypothetical protein